MALTMHPTFGYRYRLIDDIVYPPFASASVIEELRSLDWSRESDILIATYPKCGTTWMQQIVLFLLCGDSSRIVDPMAQAPWIERECSLNGFGILKAEPEFGRRVFKTHAPRELLPCSRFRGKIIVVVRNPKDAAVSMYTHYLGLPAFQYTGDWNHFFDELFVEGKVGHGDYFDHVLGWREARGNLWVSYEDMKADLPGTVREVAHYLGIKVDEDLVDRACREASFESMKRAHERRILSGVRTMGSSDHFRSGTTGSWRSFFSEDQSRRLDEIFKERMRGSDIVTDFGDGNRYRGADLINNGLSAS